MNWYRWRDDCIAERYFKGDKKENLAKEYGLAVSIVNVIIRRAKGKAQNYPIKH